jgi:hypothetical protein
MPYIVTTCLYSQQLQNPLEIRLPLYYLPLYHLPLSRLFLRLLLLKGLIIIILLLLLRGRLIELLRKMLSIR